jgi:hypothetical protein
MCIYSITSYYGRLGNNILQIVSAFIQGYDQANKYTLSNHPIFHFKNIINEGSTICNCNTIKVYNTQQLKQYDLSQLKTCYKKHISIKGDGISSNIYDIGIHIRSGDIFQIIGSSHNKYLQPPLYFYEKIISENISKKIVIVYESNHNPVVNKLVEKYKHLDNITFQSSSIINDIYTLSNCRQLVVSNGTFWLVPYFESNIIENIIIADYMKDNHWFMFDTNTKYHEIALPNYMKGQLWKNTLEQREIMVKYNNYY